MKATKQNGKKFVLSSLCSQRSSDFIPTGFGPVGFLEQRLSVGPPASERVVLHFHQGILAAQTTHAVSNVVLDRKRAHHAPGAAVPHTLGPPTLDADLASTARVVVLATGADMTSSGTGTFTTCSFRFQARRAVLILSMVFGAVPFASKNAGRNLSKERAQVLNGFRWFHGFRFLVLQ
jgi:hypothetical protein